MTGVTGPEDGDGLAVSRIVSHHVFVGCPPWPEEKPVTPAPSIADKASVIRLLSGHYTRSKLVGPSPILRGSQVFHPFFPSTPSPLPVNWKLPTR
ncbi:uncharacterized protein An18g02160 [Aspergillus niger]|uniref:Contig An18c0050, genomic contig n=2 Tax=Aspergillus niger TaxID=5061 RepID=A2RA73_ASPNC|nr:uncharacterized protein An18g02160 [Aspergillus niger]CAK47288.1 unnamed protein product [Aspergillus niger]